MTKVDENLPNKSCRNLHFFGCDDANEQYNRVRVLDSENDANRVRMNTTQLQYGDDAYDEYNECEEYGEREGKNHANDAACDDDDDDCDDIVEVEYADMDDLEDCVSSLQALMNDLQDLQQDITMQEMENKTMASHILSLDAESKNLSESMRDLHSGNELDHHRSLPTYASNQNATDTNANSNAYHRASVRVTKPSNMAPTQVSRGVKRRYNDAMRNESEYGHSQANKKRRLSTSIQQRQFCG